MDLLMLGAFLLAVLAFARARRTEARLDSDVKALRAEIAALRAAGPAAAESEVSQPALAQAETPVAEIWPRAPAETGEAVERAARGEPVMVAREEPASPNTRPVDAAPPPRLESLESRLGARWAVWTGGLALALGGVFLVRYSIEAGLVGPGIRIALALVFGLGLIGAGEIIRRRAMPALSARFSNALIPGVLTAAGAATLFGALYAAHALYGFIGPALAYILLSVVSLGVVALSLRYGQALAGLGLAGSLITPALISSDDPNFWALFIFLAIAWAGTALAARLKAWRTVPALANLGVLAWILLALLGSEMTDELPIVTVLLVMIAGTGLIWPAGALGRETVPVIRDEAADEADATPVTAPPRRLGFLRRVWSRVAVPFFGITLTLSLAVFLSVLALATLSLDRPLDGILQASAVLTGLALLAALRRGMVYPALATGFGAIGTVYLFADLLTPSTATLGALPPNWSVTAFAGGLSVLLILLGWPGLKRRLAADQAQGLHPTGALSAAVAGLSPVGLVLVSFLMVGTFGHDFGHLALSLGLALLLLVLTEASARWPGPQSPRADVARGWLMAGAMGLVAVAGQATGSGLAAVVVIAAAGLGFSLATRWRAFPALPWISVLAAAILLLRFAYEPTVVPPEALGRMPVFNALLPGYGLPALAMILAAWHLRAWPSARPRELLQALGCLFALLTLGMLVRHGLHGGVIDASAPSLGEQAIYTLLMIGAAGILTGLDGRSPSRFFRYGSMALSVMSVGLVLAVHLLALNPYWTGEPLGPLPILDLLGLGYLLPGLAFAGLAVLSAKRRPKAYVTLIGIASGVMIFAWATLCVRRAWHGEGIADWKGFMPAETYAYSAVWLALGVILLIAGARRHAAALRLASAALVLIAVLKVFLVDMSNLEGVLRALSFIGLGAVLIGIGLFYQKILSGVALPALPEALRSATSAPSENRPEPESADDTDPERPSQP
ncbi:hypothetical protein BJF93_17215 [Xaviernesmea oryzae]|uniref:DUF2339 domain-containing protein n=1 Tax=Xaviernesmea oryzae TaxID=464029 RepID=A0A1Q9AT83_9HYPH|nr:DUF2339 domain-containing protein [Xaviernesmea oryzae]OLP58589.1 hypothetical protein BJF93_17215 [Xaviernesmea oryzae]SEK63340.1 Uncharacterized membrane protein [Xaviernesmea oryzae]